MGKDKELPAVKFGIRGVGAFQQHVHILGEDRYCCGIYVDADDVQRDRMDETLLVCEACAWTIDMISKGAVVGVRN